MPLVPLGAPEGRDRWTVVHDDRSFLVLASDEAPDGYVVTDALCPHKLLPLAEGIVRDGALVCPGHWYAYDLVTGECRTTGGVTLPVYAVSRADGALVADIPDRVAPLSWSERLRAHATGPTTGPPA